MKDAKLTVYYDGACPLCAAEIAIYRRARGADGLSFVDVADSGSGSLIGPDLPRKAALARFHIRGQDGRLSSGAAGFAALWRVLPGWRWLGRIAGTRAVLPVAEAFYLVFLPLRPYIARALRLCRRESSVNRTVRSGKQMIDISTASAGELDTVPALRGHGHEIVRYREDGGRFTAIRQLNEVPGLAGKVDGLEGTITVAEQQA